ncbi:hypothetical protein KOI35_10485 [Actinoplanes bogorensis]|uniref:3-hydroxyacyl-CoA dehydrogenase NAD binding domain-containing protein n=1 Tax=Paractinoplanes bogorensis TaxID=1610840 RepID=A0ABS5YKR1_9ACTN|nr:3-hydroxyacyl-CoA dehydrogenase NAD-binding domain-containing protein [Actinoplanes bogorensis]MBU2663916.1 hypothetical protein [Actinoplanes bogorensis]
MTTTAIVGTGNVGSALAELFARAGLDVRLAPVRLGRIDEGGRLIEAPGPHVLRNLVEVTR